MDYELWVRILPMCVLNGLYMDVGRLQKLLKCRYPFLVAWLGSPPPGARDAPTEKFGMTYGAFIYSAELVRQYSGEGE
jgi:hypothetical protein